jgi:4-amino-4-deoxy-L-arabinose transferase-like glycosyltransferase
MTNDEGTSCRPLMLLAIAIAAVMFVFPLFVPFPLLDPDEGLHASIAQEMVERGDWITPRFLGEFFPDKPILYFWIQAASLRLLGPTEAAVRLPGLMFGLLGAVTTGLLAWRMFGRKTGWIAGVFYATTILPTALAQAASHDVALVPWVNLAMLLLWESIPRIPHTPCAENAHGETGCATRRRTDFQIRPAVEDGLGNLSYDDRQYGLTQFQHGTRRLPNTLCTVGAGLFLGLSILTKGMLGVAVVGLAYGGYLLITWRVKPSVLLQGAAVLLIAVLIAAPWYLAVESQHPDFLRYYFFERHVLGFASGKQPHSDQPWWYYLPILLGGGLPWIAYLRWARSGKPAADDYSLAAASTRRGVVGALRRCSGAVAAWTRRLNADYPSPVAFLWFWLIGWTVFLTVAQSKLATYLWPAFPPLAILAAVAWTRMIDGSLGERCCGAGDSPADAETAAQQRSFARAFIGSCWGGPIVLPAAVAVLQWVFAIRFGWPAWVVVVLVALASPLPLIPWHAGRRQASMAAAALSLAAQFVVVMTLILPRLADMYSARDLAEHFNRVGQIPPRLLLAEERVGSFVFYLDPQLRAGLTENQVQYLSPEPPTPLRPGDVVAVKERNLSKTAEWLDLRGETFERVGCYRLYRVAKPQAVE